jgi:hypothetical protein
MFTADKRWFICSHALERMIEFGLDRATVVDICDDPEVSYPPYLNRNERRIYVKGEFAVVAHPADKVIITVLRNLPEWWHRILPA